MPPSRGPGGGTGTAHAAVAAHYANADLVETIRAGLLGAGKDPDRLLPEDLATVDEFHVRGRAASLELAARLAPRATERVLDVGSGLGGAARLLASIHGCHVTGIDLTAAYCQAAAVLSAWVGLADRVAFCQADATALPFADASFDAAWTQHAAMNIPDKARVYAEVFRVLRRGGRFALYDVLQGAGGPVRFPVPWAREPSISHLVTPDALQALLTGAGFTIESWRDTTVAGRDWFVAHSRRILRQGAPPLGFALLLGPDFARMAENQVRNLVEDRIALIEAVCRKA